MVSSTASSCVTSCLLAPVTIMDSGTPRASTRIWRLLPFFSPIRRIRSYSFLGERSLDRSSVNALPSPSDAFHLIVFSKPCTPKSQEKAFFQPYSEILVDRAGTAKALLGECLPLATCTQHEKDSFKHSPCIHRFSTASRLTLEDLVCWSLQALRNKGLRPLPELLGNLPRSNSCHITPPLGEIIGRCCNYCQVICG